MPNAVIEPSPLQGHGLPSASLLRHRTCSKEECEHYHLQSDSDAVVAIILSTFLTEDLVRGPSINSIATSLSLSSSHLRHIVKRRTGRSFRAHLKAARLSRASHLLLKARLTVKEAMFAVGISDHSHFARDYKKHIGESPSQTRIRATASAIHGDTLS